MRTLNIAQDIIPVGEFKTGISKWLRNIREEKHPIVITQNGRPAGVLITPEEYDSLVYNRKLDEAVQSGLRDITDGRSYSTTEIKEILQTSRHK
ncbi:MAG: type II toxin-antitoxin system Phd/YefM family antitoxin [Candidatus Marinimicrobia bacterium]|nr:type II toxin-antitoxin system Phd/YefM family antitoxin [Candidatus Neomarinimicrobiota bacterium]